MMKRPSGATVLATALVISVLLTSGALLYAVTSNSDAADVAQARAEAAQAIAQQARATGIRIQGERERNIRNACEMQNERHDDAVTFIDHVIATAPPAQRAAAKANRKVTVAFINTLAPHQNCDDVVRRQTRVGAP